MTSHPKNPTITVNTATIATTRIGTTRNTTKARRKASQAFSGGHQNFSRMLNSMLVLSKSPDSELVSVHEWLQENSFAKYSLK